MRSLAGHLVQASAQRLQQAAVQGVARVVHPRTRRTGLLLLAQKTAVLMRRRERPYWTEKRQHRAMGERTSRLQLPISEA